MRILTLAIAFGVCSTPSWAADEFTAEKAKTLIPDAAGIPAEELAKLATADVPTPDGLKGSRGETLLWWVLTHQPGGPKAPEKPTSFRFIGETLNPAKIVEVLSGPRDKDGKFRKTASLIHPEYITDCTCKVNGDAATGVVTFKADKVYEGKIEYTARKKDGAWRIEEFRLPEYKVTLALGADGKWAKK